MRPTLLEGQEAADQLDLHLALHVRDTVRDHHLDRVLPDVAQLGIVPEDGVGHGVEGRAQRERFLCQVHRHGQLVAVLIAIATASAASTGAVSLCTLTTNSDLIIYGTVGTLVVQEQPLQPDPAGEMQGRTLYQVRASMTVLETIKGQVPDSGLLVTTSAGMEDSAVFRTGEYAVLFLILNEDGETYRTAALAQGKFDVSDGKVLRPDLSIEEFLSKVRHDLAGQ